MTSLEPVPFDQLERLPKREQQLNAIGDVIAYWLRWNKEIRDTEELDTPPDTYIMLPGDNAPPYWPTVGQLQFWLSVLRGGEEFNREG